jgi:hypothetical protein
MKPLQGKLLPPSRLYLQQPRNGCLSASHFGKDQHKGHYPLYMYICTRQG